MIGRAPPRTAGFALRQQWETVDLCRMPSRSNDFHAAEAAKAAEAAAAAAAAAKSAGGRRRDDVAVEAKTEAATHSRAPRRSSAFVMKMRQHEVLKQQRNVMMLRGAPG